MPHKSDPPMGGWTEDGKPIWGKTQKEYCKGHGHYLHRSEFSGVEWVQYYCKECLSAKRKMKREESQKPQKNPLAYTHMVRRESDGVVFKHHILNGSLEDGYTVFYTVKPGYDLPKKFRSYPVYEPESSN